MPDLLDRIRSEIDDRLRELRPLTEEVRQLETALQALDTGSGNGEAPARGRRGRRTSTRAAGTPQTPARTRAPRGATRDAVLRHVEANGAATAGDIANATGLSRTSIAATLTKLAADGGPLRKADRGYELTTPAKK